MILEAGYEIMMHVYLCQTHDDKDLDDMKTAHKVSNSQLER